MFRTFNRTLVAAATGALMASSALAGDLVINFDDLNLILGNWGMMVTPGTAGDIDGSGTVDFGDLNIVLGAWDTSCL